MSAWEKHADGGASPIPPSAEVIVQGQIKPHGRTSGKLEKPEHDYVIYNRCPVFATQKQPGAMNHSSRYRGAKQRRLGNVPDIWSNFYMRGLLVNNADDLPTPERIRFLGVSQDGQHNGKDAKAFPESAGRLAVTMQGAVSMIVDERYLENPCIGDLLQWIPEDSGLRIKGTAEYGLPIIRKLSPQELQPTRPTGAIVAGAAIPPRADGFADLNEAKLALKKLDNTNYGNLANNPPNFIGIYLGHTPGENEVRVLLMPNKII